MGYRQGRPVGALYITDSDIYIFNLESIKDKKGREMTGFILAVICVLSTLLCILIVIYQNVGFFILCKHLRDIKIRSYTNILGYAGAVDFVDCCKLGALL